MKKSLLRFTVGAALSAIAGVAASGSTTIKPNLVSNTSGVAPVTDPQLINPWGISRGSGEPLVDL